MIHKVKNYKKGYDIRITDKNGNSFYMVFAGNLDLFWVSEASGEKHTQNTMQIIKKQDEFEVVFNHNPERFASKNYTSVCFCNSGSNHSKIVESFMKVYIALVNYDKIEEYQKN